MAMLRLFKNLKTSRACSFTCKIYLTLSACIIVISCSFTAFFLHHLKESRMEILVNKGELLVEQLAENARIGAFADNRELLLEPAGSVLRQREVLAVEIFSSDGKLLTRLQKDGIKPLNEPGGTAFREEEQGIMRELGKSAKPVHILGGDMIDFWAPVKFNTSFAPVETLLYTDNPQQPSPETIGYARVILDKTSLDESFQPLLYNIILTTTVIFIIILFAAYFITRGITKPLSRLHESVLALGTGASVDRIPVESKDEVGRLASAFNKMAESLRMRENEKEQLTEQLIQAQKMEAVGTLAGGIAHDFNNILTAITGYSHLLLMKTAEDNPLRNFIKQIQNSSDRAAELTHGLLAFSRKQVMMPKAVELNEIVDHLRKMLRRLISADIELNLELAKEDLVVMADRGKIEQVLMNLVTNARDAMTQEGRITISTSSMTMNGGFLHTHGYGKPGEYACIAVSDTGTGMDEETKSKIFEPFFTTKEVGKGTGLGLSIVYGIVKQHNGYINVYSEQCKGTTFRIYLPFIEAKKEAPVVKNGVTPRGGSETLLLAEDDPAVCSFHKALLKDAGYQVITAADGAEALRKFAENEDVIRLLILDAVMPKLNGKQVFEFVRKGKPQMKAMFMSGYSADMLNYREIIMQNICFMMKPIDPCEFLSKVREELDRPD